jgi:hypothetical protein
MGGRVTSRERAWATPVPALSRGATRDATLRSLPRAALHRLPRPGRSAGERRGYAGSTPAPADYITRTAAYPESGER